MPSPSQTARPIFRRSATAAIVSFVATIALAVEATQAESYGPGTLLRWSYGKGGEGGPDLNEPLVTDRPDFTESSVTVGYGVAQLEMGYTFTYDRTGDDRVRNHSFPETLLRLGTLAEWFELRVDWNYGIENSEIGGVEDSISGAEDLGLGMKFALTGQEGILPETAIILQMTVPTGADAFSANEVLPGFNFLYGWDITDKLSTGASTAINNQTDDVTADSYTEFSQSWTFNYSFTERFRGYAEWYVLAPTSADTNRAENYFNGGFTVLLNDNIQWDIRAGVGLNDAADDFFAGSGLSLRYF